jgi:CPA2 family monovalent cation:H+ antiporter-2
MDHQVTLIATIAVCFVFASAFGYAADRLRLPPLVGFLVAGIMIGPFTPGFVADSELAGQLAEMGVILLMFGVGLHFSASDLLAVRGVAVPGAICQIALATPLGIGLAWLWGWGIGAGIVLGFSLSVASTVVQLKSLEERNQLGTPAGRAAVGWLIMEDLVTVVALVLLPMLAETLGAAGAGGEAHGAAPSGDQSLALTVAMTLAKVTVFAVIAMTLGPRIVPWVLTKVARTGSRELFTLSVLALAVGIAYGSAEIFGVSFALGAFVAGLVLGESNLSHKAAAESLPLQDAFSVLFFVSVGMLFNPLVIVEKPLDVFAVVAIIIIGRSLLAFGLIVLLRYPISMALTITGGRAQIGEFSFILAALGISVGLMPAEGRDLILAGSIISITLNPLTIMATTELQRRIRARWPNLVASYGRSRYDAMLADLEKNRIAQEERESARHVRIQAVVDTFPLLSLLNSDEQEELLLLFRAKSASPGERVMRTGDRPDGMYFLQSGAVEVRVAGRSIRLEAGSFFGEMALLSGSRRTADIIAVDFCEFLVLERRDFNQFMARHPNLRAAVHKMARERLEDNQAYASYATGSRDATEGA